ncbi:MAG: redox-regulated ATPase YchF [Candidatus Margulisiibacteriota bacterium]
MGFSLGIVGLPNVGKSTLFNILSRARADVSNYPFTTIKPNVGVVEVPDDRLYQVQKIMGSPKAIPTIIEFYDIAGLVKGAHMGEGLGNQFLSHIREVDALAHVVRCFSSPEVAHVPGEVDPQRDIEIINIELALADLKVVEKKIEELSHHLKTGNQKIAKELEVAKKIREKLDRGIAVRLQKLDQEEIKMIKSLNFLTSKPVLYVANVDESGNLEEVEKVKTIAQKEGTKVVSICAKLEAEISELSKEEAEEYLREVGIEGGGLSKLIRQGYELLDLITFFTANEKEARAWTVKRGTKLPQAAGKIHSDMERGFISAEVVHYFDLLGVGSYAKARESGLIHVEGKEYQIQDGDLILIKFVV